MRVERLFPPRPEPFPPVLRLTDWLVNSGPVTSETPVMISVHDVHDLLVDITSRGRPQPRTIIASRYALECFNIAARYYRRKAKQKASKRAKRRIGRSRW